MTAGRSRLVEPPLLARLPDGRGLAYSELGDPGGRPLFYCHGFPACRLEARFAHEGASEAGFRLVAPDRPGLGRSDPRPGRRLLDWAGDVAALADQLQVDTYAVVGVSGGGPYALACAAGAPERIQAVGLVCALGPLPGSGDAAAMHWSASLALRLARRAPTLSGAVHRWLTVPLMTRFPDLSAALLGASGSEADRRVLADLEVRRRVRDNVSEALRQGGVGPAEDLALLASDWGFEPEDVNVPVRLWHGDADAVVPPAMGARLAERLPRSRARILHGEGHYSLVVTRMSGILTDLARVIRGLR